MACTTILVGKNASYDGSTMIARNDDSGAGHYMPKKFVVVHPEERQKVYRSVISHVEIELPDNPLRCTSMPNAVDGEGIWAASGVNAKNVAMTATETITSNPRVLGADPLVVYEPAKDGKEEKAGGIGEEDIVYIVLPYITSAREGVKRLGSLLETYGTYEMNGIAFQDKDEIWWLETIGGHHWIARRVPDDVYVVMPNQFGMDEADIKTIIGEADKYNLHFAGIHFFDKSQKRDVSKIGEELLKLESLCREIKEKFGYAVEQIEYGPGLDADYFSEWPAEAEKKLLKEAAYVLREFVQNYHVTIEMGRFFSACCGYYLTKVVDLKCCGGLRYAIVDGGSHQLHYDGQMMGMKVPPVCILQRRKETDNMGKNEFQEWAICGSLCTHNDLISRRVPFQNLQIGDILCFAYIGAYSVTEGMTTFLTRDIPPVVLYSQKTGLICMRKRMETVMLNGGCMTERGIYRE